MHTTDIKLFFNFGQKMVLYFTRQFRTLDHYLFQLGTDTKLLVILTLGLEGLLMAALSLSAADEVAINKVLNNAEQEDSRTSVNHVGDFLVADIGNYEE